MNGFIDAKFDRSRFIKFLEDLDFGVTAARILNLGPTQFDVSLYSKDNCSLRIFRRTSVERDDARDLARSRSTFHSVHHSVCLSRSRHRTGLECSLSTPASFNAALFATAPCPSARPKITGLLGATLSRSQRVGNAAGFQ